MNNSHTEAKTAWSLNPFSSKYAPGGAVEQALATQAEARAAENNTAQDKLTNEALTTLLGLGLFGVGAGVTGTKLYNLISGTNPVKDKYKKFGPGPKALDEEEKLAEDSWTKTITDAISSSLARAQSLVPSTPVYSKMDENQKAIFVPAALAAAGLGLYGGNSLMRSIEDKKRKEDMKYELDEAKQEYRRALTGKRAEALDMAFASYKRAAESQNKQAGIDPIGTAAWAGDWAMAPLRELGLLPLYSTAVLGTGLMSGKMTYDWTRERSKDKALERARRSRARIEDTNPLYVDPAQLEAIKALHQKEVEKIKQKELA